MVRKEDDEVIGGLLIRLLPPYEEDLEIGWQLDPSAWGEGLVLGETKRRSASGRGAGPLDSGAAELDAAT